MKIKNIKTESANRRTGQVARLPIDARTLVNQSIRNGLTYPAIVAKLTDAGHPNLASESIGQWARSGYRDWLQQQEQTEANHPLGPLTQSLLARFDSDTIPDLANLCEALVAARLTTTLHSFNPALLQKSLAEKPEEFHRYFTMTMHFLSQRVERQKLEFKCQKHEDKIAAEEAERLRSEEQREISRIRSDAFLHAAIQARANRVTTEPDEPKPGALEQT